MPKRGNAPIQGEMLQGTLDLLILKTLAIGAAHGHTIAYAIERRSEDVLQVEHGSLYPALHRLEDRGWISSFWGTSENNRRARYYRLTPAGQKQLTDADQPLGRDRAGREQDSQPARRSEVDRTCPGPRFFRREPLGRRAGARARGAPGDRDRREHRARA